MFNPALYSQLQCNCIHDTPEHSTEQRACRESSSSYLSGISWHKTICEVEQRRTYKCILFHLMSCVPHAVYSILHDTTCLLHQQQFCPVCMCWNPSAVCLGYCLGPLGVGYFSGHNSSSELDSFGFWSCDISDLATSCRKFLFVFVFCIQKCTSGCTVQRIHLAIWPFSSELTNNWGTCLLYLWPSWYCCTGKQ